MEEQLTLLKELLGMDTADTSNDKILNHYLKKARDIILGFCNISELPIEYDDVVVDYAVILYRNRNSEGFEKKSEGEKSVTYEAGIPASIRMALPLPKVKIGGY